MKGADVTSKHRKRYYHGARRGRGGEEGEGEKGKAERREGSRAARRKAAGIGKSDKGTKERRDEENEMGWTHNGRVS